MAGGEVQLVALTKRFDDVEAVAGIDLHIPCGEFFSILGPSGCGKTTTLRLVAGFEEPTSGSILLDGEDVARKPPHKRNVNTVFQSYALFPFLTVADNVAFGLRYQEASKAERVRRVGAALELVQLQGYERRRPGQLSGGQQQRVALARALVLNPSVLLLDEPLGALDAKLRRTLQVELKSLQEHVGITFLYVTHDQEEALTMSDRLAVMEAGKVAQVGPPGEVYEQPANAYVADFLGVSNLMQARATGRGSGDHCRLRLGDFDLRPPRARPRPRGRCCWPSGPSGWSSSPTTPWGRTACPAWSSASSSSVRPPRSSSGWPKDPRSRPSSRTPETTPSTPRAMRCGCTCRLTPSGSCRSDTSRWSRTRPCRHRRCPPPSRWRRPGSPPAGDYMPAIEVIASWLFAPRSPRVIQR